MRNITKIFTLVLSLILLFAVSCSNDDKTGVKNNPPENDTEITDGETGSSGSGTGGSGTGGSGTETGGGSGTGGTGTGGSEEGGSGSGTGTGGDSGSGSGTGGSGSGSGSGEGGGGTVTPPSETEPTEEGYFPPPAGDYRDENVVSSGYSVSEHNTKVSEEGGTKTRIDGIWIDSSGQGYRVKFSVSKWKKTTKGGKIAKTEAVEIVDVASIGSGPPTFSKVIYDYETKTLSGTCKFISSGTEKTCSINGKLVE